MTVHDHTREFQGYNLDGNRNGKLGRRVVVNVLPYFKLRKKAGKIVNKYSVKPGGKRRQALKIIVKGEMAIMMEPYLLFSI